MLFITTPASSVVENRKLLLLKTRINYEIVVVLLILSCEQVYNKRAMSDEESDEIDDLGELPEKSRNSSSLFQVSGWENDNDGIEEEQNPHGK